MRTIVETTNPRRTLLPALGMACAGIPAVALSMPGGKRLGVFWPADEGSLGVGGNSRTLARASLAARLPVVVGDEDAVRLGCLASYRAFEPSPYPRLAAIVAQVLRGASPAEIPFQNPQQFQLAINRRAAAALGIAVPPDLLLRADRVFE